MHDLHLPGVPTSITLNIDVIVDLFCGHWKCPLWWFSEQEHRAQDKKSVGGIQVHVMV